MLEKEHKRQDGILGFKTWLKNNLYQQRQIEHDKARAAHTKTLEEEDSKKRKEN
jgi:hypothetical protein